MHTTFTSRPARKTLCATIHAVRVAAAQKLEGSNMWPCWRVLQLSIAGKHLYCMHAKYLHYVPLHASHNTTNAYTHTRTHTHRVLTKRHGVPVMDIASNACSAMPSCCYVIVPACDIYMHPARFHTPKPAAASAVAQIASIWLESIPLAVSRPPTCCPAGQQLA